MESETYTASGDAGASGVLRRLEALVERPPAGPTTGSLPVAPVVAASLAGLRAEMTGLEQRMVAIEESVSSFADRIDARLSALDDRIAAMSQAMGYERTVAEEHRERTNEAMQEQVAALEEWAEAVRAGLEDLGDAVASSLNTLGETVQDPAPREADRRHLEALLGEVMTSIDEMTAPLDGRMASVQEAVLDGFAAARDRLLGDLGGALESLERAAVQTRDNVEGQLSDLRNDFADALDEMREHVSGSVGASTETVAGALEELRLDWQPRTDQVIAEGRAAAQGVLDDVRADVRRAMTDLTDSLEGQIAVIANATGTIGDGTDRLVAAGQLLVAYLAERDRILERERDQVLRDVLDEFAEGLSPRERRAVASRVAEAVERHRDSRDAERFRRGAAGSAELAVPAVPDLIERLAEPLPEPTQALPRRSTLRASASAPAREDGLTPVKPPAVKAPAVKAPAVKRATPAAARRTAKKAASPAKRTAAKPAKKTAAKRPELPSGSD
ncbi:MAG TPA: hypothetical protein VHB69_12570 [Mycobacteriales bacterium]|nr:hypothetical protein [Mycobacteriales bacterium]